MIDLDLELLSLLEPVLHLEILDEVGVERILDDLSPTALDPGVPIRLSTLRK